MSDNKKYYYLKLKDNFYDQEHIKYIESHENGYIFSNILMKLYLRSLKFEGCLRITETIPFDPGDVTKLAKIIGHDPSHVGNAVNLAIDLGIMVINDLREMWFADIQNYIGRSSTEGDRKREHRKRINGTNVLQMSDERPPELELETNIELETETSKRADGTEARVLTNPSPKSPSKKNKDKEINIANMINDDLNTDKFRAAWADWCASCRERKKPMTATRAKYQINKLNKMGHDDAILSIEQSIENSYQGLFDPKKQNKEPERKEHPWIREQRLKREAERATA